MIGNETEREMDEEKMSVAEKNIKEDEAVSMPGFRFHPTDEELVGFYLRRRVEGKPISIELIKQLDIYKYEPWDLAKVSTVGDKEWYFYCIRGRKYRNSTRPNRVTGCGFWKATGIDKPIYSNNGETDQYCIGLKKSLVFYRGHAGKGTKTDWMMHEFRLPPTWKNSNTLIQEAEVWTLCRIFKRPTKCHNTHDQSKQIIIEHGRFIATSSKTCSFESENSDRYMNIKDMMVQRKETETILVNQGDEGSHFHVDDDLVSVAQSSAALSNYSSFWNSNVNQVLGDGTWDELRSEFGVVIFNPTDGDTWS